MKLYHALSKERYDQQIQDGVFKPYWNKLMKDMPCGIWATENPVLSYNASSINGSGEEYEILEIDCANLNVENTGDWKVPGNGYFIIREWEIPLSCIRKFDDMDHFKLNWN